jgi:hypothetical protein
MPAALLRQAFLFSAVAFFPRIKTSPQKNFGGAMMLFHFRNFFLLTVSAHSVEGFIKNHQNRHYPRFQPEQSISVGIEI